MPWRRAFTTNFDDVFEESAKRAGKRLTSITPSDKLSAVPLTEPLCIHLNGYVHKLTRENLSSELKLTETSYLTASLADSPWAVLLRQDVELARAVIFIGYSVADLDIGRILLESPSLKNKSLYVLGPAPDRRTLRLASRLGNALAVSLADFAAQVEDQLKTYKPPAPHTPQEIAFRIHRHPAPLAELNDVDVIDLLLTGRVNAGLIPPSLTGDIRYYLERPQVEDVMSLLASGERILALVSDLGNGKTVALEGIKERALESGFTVIVPVERTPDIIEELELLIRQSQRPLLILDNYSNWLDVARFFYQHAGDRAALLLAGRSALHDVLVDDLVATLGIDSIHEVFLDRLSDVDTEWVAELLTAHGLWGVRAGEGKSAKLHFLKRNCRREFHAILLSVLESPQMLERLKALEQPLRGKREYYEVLVTVLVLAVLQVPVSMRTLADIWGPDRINDRAFRRDPQISQLVDFAQGELQLRSAVVAQHLLGRVVDINITQAVLTRIARRADASSSVSRSYRDLLSVVMRFANLQQLLPREKRLAAVVRYYETIKNLSHCRLNPLFWLQYAIASVTLGDLERARRYFDSAYSLAREARMDLYQIDNHYARYLLEEAVAGADPSRCMSSFREARRILNEQVKRDQLHYPFRVAAHYADFVETFAGRLSGSDLAEVERAIRYVLDRIAGLPEYRRRQRYVHNCKERLEYSIALIDESAKGQK